MSEFDFFTWYNSEATPEEKKVISKIGMFEELFSDMAFQPGTETASFLVCQTKAEDDPEDCWRDCMTDIPEEIEYFSPSNFKVKVENLDEGIGQFNIMTKELTITPDHVESDSVILHEMIHLYEDMLDSQLSFYRDIVFFSMYTRLKKRIPALDEIITDHANVFNQQQFNMIGGIHNILFILKSFDLDIKQGYKLGTVFGYGMEEQLSQYNYQ